MSCTAVVLLYVVRHGNTGLLHFLLFVWKLVKVSMKASMEDMEASMKVSIEDMEASMKASMEAMEAMEAPWKIWKI